jgi:hypothetical protein
MIAKNPYSSVLGAKCGQINEAEQNIPLANPGQKTRGFNTTM